MTTVSLEQVTVSSEFIQEKAHQSHIIKLPKEVLEGIMKTLSLRSLKGRKQCEKFAIFLMSKLELRGHLRDDLVCKVHSEANPTVFHLTVDLMTEDQRVKWNEQKVVALKERIKREIKIGHSENYPCVMIATSSLFQLIAKHVGMSSVKPYEEDKAKFANFVFQTLDLNLRVFPKADIWIFDNETIAITKTIEADNWLAGTYGKVE